MTERIQKLIAASGLCSRRQAEEYLCTGRVTVNGTVVSLGDKADGEKDRICVDGKEIHFTEEKIYILLHKPRGYTCTLKDAHAKHPVTELVDCGKRVYPVGRLDQDSEGLLLLTNDGAFMQAMTHPRHEVDKVYEVWVTGMTARCVEKLRSMTSLDGEPIAPAQVEVLHSSGTQALLRMTIHQGKNRQIRRMCARVGLSVTRLKRVAEHGLSLGELPLGQWRCLTGEELLLLKGGNTDGK